MIPFVFATVGVAPTAVVHQVNLSVSKDVAPSSKIQVNVNTQNVRTIHLSALPIDGERWLSIPNPKMLRPATIGGPVKTWDLSIAKPTDKPNPNQADTYYSRQVNLPNLKPGVYLLSSSGGDQAAWAVVNVTDLAVIVKRSSKHALVWVTDFKTGKVVPNASVRYFNLKGQLIGGETTRSDGTAFMKLDPSAGTFIVRRRYDLAGIENEQGNPDGRLVAHFETDRPIYRPGQKISFKAILRRTLGTAYSVVPPGPCLVQLRDPKENPVEEMHLTSNAMGTVSGEVTIPTEGMTGPYTLVLRNGKDIAYQTLSVAEYRKPEFKVDVKPSRNRYLAGDPISFEVDSSYFFGAPVPQAQVHFQVRRHRLPFEGYDPVTQAFYSGDGNLYAQDTYQADAFVGEDSVFTDNKGKAVIRLKTDPLAGDSTYSITCTVSDASHRQVESSSSVPVYSAALRLGLSSSVNYSTLGSLIPVTIRLVDLDGNPASGRVNLVLKRNVYDSTKNEWKEEEFTSTAVRMPASGTYTIQLPAKYEGDLHVYATCPDNTGHTARSGLDLYVAGNYEVPKAEKEEPTIGIRLDKREYKPDEFANAFVNVNNPKLPILMVLEGADIWEYRVVSTSSRGQNWRFQTGLRLSPNAYATTAQWIKGQLLSANAMLPLPDRSKALKVTVIPDKTTYGPGDQAAYAIHTEDGHGKPVSAEVSVGVVDEAIFAMSPDQTADLYRLYWGLRQNGVTMQSSAPEELSGGAYQRVNSLAPVRQRFEDTAFWAPAVTTDASGNGQIHFEMPGNLTTWRATARAVTLDTSVGSGSSKVIATRPVTLRLAAPRQMIVGDRVTLIGTIDNRSSSEHEFNVRLDASGLDIAGSRTKTLRIGAHGEGKVEWSASAKSIPDDGVASLSGQVEARDNGSPDFADALRVGVPIRPNGLPQKSVVGGSLTTAAQFSFELPPNRMEPSSSVKIVVRSGLKPVMEEAASSILDSPRYGTVGATNQLEAANGLGLGSQDDHFRESLALLARTQGNEGWGWWANAPADPVLTARTLRVLADSRNHGFQVFDNMLNAAKEATVSLYNRTNLWEVRALLASSLAIAGDKRGAPLLDEVSAHATSISPNAWLHLAEGFLAVNKAGDANRITKQVLANVDEGPTEAYLPAGEGTEWTGTDIETTAEALYVLARLNAMEPLQLSLARWLASPDQSWRSSEEDAAIVRALSAYLATHSEDAKLGAVTVVTNGTKVDVKESTVDQSVTAQIPNSLLKDGKNSVEIEKSSSGQAFYSVESLVYLPDTSESVSGIRILRRYEVKNSGGTWVELNRPVAIGEPVRCTLLAWGDNLRDAIQLTEPIPAGFEFVEDESSSGGDEEIRDAAVVHYILNAGVPQSFSYYIRSESAGLLTALPASAAYLRRPRLRGNTQPLAITVTESK